MNLARMTSRGRMTIPKRVRAALGLRGEDMVTLTLVDGYLVIRKLVSAPAVPLPHPSPAADTGLEAIAESDNPV